MTISKIRETVVKHGEKIRRLQRCIRLSTFDHEDNIVAILAMARQLGLSFDELCACIWLRQYSLEWVESGCDLPWKPRDVAKMFNIPYQDFEAFMAECREEELSERDEFLAAIPLRRTNQDNFPWETEENIMSDLLDEAISVGYCS